MARRTCSSRLQECLVVCGVDAHLRNPAHAERGERFGEFAGEGEIGGEVIVDEEEQPLLGSERRDFGDDSVDRPVAGRALEEGLDGAELAGEAAAAAGLDQPDGKIIPAAKDRPVVAHCGQVGLRVRAVERPEPPGAGILDHRGPDVLGLADDHGFGVVLDLLGH
jgi:hypothetical protein